MSSGPDSGGIGEQLRQAEQLLSTGKPAEAAGVLAAVAGQLEREGSTDRQLRADVARLRGSALRDAGDLEGSTRCLEAAIGALAGVTRTDTETVVLASALRLVALNYDAFNREPDATDARRRALDLARSLTERLPEQAVGIVCALSDELWRTKGDWQAPLESLFGDAANLGLSAALTVYTRLQYFWERHDDRESASRAIESGYARIQASDAKAAAADFAALHNFGWAALRMGDLDTAADVARRLVEVEAAVDAGGRHAAQRLAANVAWRRGDADALEKAKAAHALAVELFGPNDRRSRLSQREVADALAREERYEEAADVYREVLRLERQFGRDQLEVAEIAFSLGRALDQAQRFREAEEAHQAALTIRLKVLGPDAADTNESLWCVAELSRVLGRAEEAEFYFVKAIAAARRQNRLETEFGARLQNNLADLYLRLGRYAEARPLIEAALAVRTKLFGADSERAWRSRETLATWERDAGDLRRAIAQAREAISRPDDAKSASWHLLLASAQLKAGDIAAAEPAFRRLYEKMGGANLNSLYWWEGVADAVKGLATCLALRGAWPDVAATALSTLEPIRRLLPDLVQSSSEMQVARFARRTGEILSLWLTALRKGRIDDPQTVAGAFELTEVIKGIRTRYLNWRQPGVVNADYLLPGDRDQSTQDRLDELARVQAELTAALLNSKQAGDPDHHQLGLRARIRRLERVLAQQIGALEIELDQPLVGSAPPLPAGAVALAIVTVDDVLAERAGEMPAPRYAAFIVGPGNAQPVTFIDVGLCADLDEAVHGLKDSIMGEPWIDAEPAWSRLARFLGQRIITPAWSRLESAQHLLVAPDGALAALPFELLATPGGDRVIDRLRVSYLIRVGELQRYRNWLRIDGAPLILAGPNFDLAGASTAKRKMVVVGRSPIAGALAVKQRFAALAEAQKEGESLGRLLGVEPLIGSWALASELLRANSPEIVHISTHGFCLPYQDAAADSVSPGMVASDPLDQRMVLQDSLQRSGLAFSGANARLDGRPLPDEVAEGFVFAADIQRLNLRRTDLVVLSACRSGLGDIELGDGAHGMRRAFFAAGCRSVVSALWDIPEASSRELMEAFYAGLLAKKDRLTALSEARAQVRARHPQDPIHWAGFILDGEFGPLARFSGVANLKVAVMSMSEWGVTSASDDAAMGKLAQRIVRGPETRSTDPRVLSVVSLRRALTRPELQEETRVFALTRLGDLANRLGENEEAVAYYRSALAVKDISATARAAYSYNIAKIRHGQGEVQAAIAAYTDVLAQNPEPEVRASTLVNRGSAYLQGGQHAEARADFTAVIDDPESPRDQQFLARMNRASVQVEVAPSAALDDVEAAFALNVASEQETQSLRYVRAAARVSLGETRTAMEEVAALERLPTLPETLRVALAALRQTIDASSVAGRRTRSPQSPP